MKIYAIAALALLLSAETASSKSTRDEHVDGAERSVSTFDYQLWGLIVAALVAGGIVFSTMNRETSPASP
jgi:hypothetical protein